MGLTTTYDVKIRYRTQDQASKPVKEIAQEVQRAERSTGGLKSALLGLGAAVGGGMLLRGAKSALIDFNNTLEQGRISLAVQERMFRGGSWAGAMESATGLFKHYQETAKASVGTTQDFLRMHSMIAASAYRAGMTIEQVKDMTQGAVIAGSSLGLDADMAGRDIMSALSGQVSLRDPLTRSLLAAANVTMEQFRAMSQQEQGKLIHASLKSATFRDAAREMEASFDGVASTFKDSLSIAFGAAGESLFASVKGELTRVSAWMEQNKNTIADWGRSFSRGLMTGFRAIKSIAEVLWPLVQTSLGAIRDAAAFFVDNKAVLYGLLAVKGARMGLGMAAGLAGGMGGAGGKGGMFGGIAGDIAAVSMGLKGFGASTMHAVNGLDSFFKGLGSMVPLWRNLAGIAGTAGFGYAAGSLLNQGAKELFGKSISDELYETVDYWTGQTSGIRAQQAQAEREGRSGGTSEQARAMIADYARRIADGRGTIQTRAADGAIKTNDLTQEFAKSQVINYMRKRGANDIEIAAELRAVAKGLSRLPLAKDFPEALRQQQEANKAKVATPGAPEVNVTIQKIQVDSADPDRFVVGLVRSFEQIVQNPTSARAAFRGAF